MNNSTHTPAQYLLFMLEAAFASSRFGSLELTMLTGAVRSNETFTSTLGLPADEDCAVKMHMLLELKDGTLGEKDFLFSRTRRVFTAGLSNLISVERHFFGGVEWHIPNDGKWIQSSPPSSLLSSSPLLLLI